MAARTPDWLLERIALGELPAPALAAARARLEREPDGRARLERLEADARATLERHPPERVAAEVERRRRVRALVSQLSPGPERTGHWGGFVSLGVPVAACLVLLVLGTSRDLPPEPGPVPVSVSPATLDSTRIKGDARLVVHRQGAQAAELLTPRSQARPGDLLQLSYLSAGKRHGVVLSLDGRGSVTLHYPERLTGSTALQPGESVALPHAYELDDAPAFERFVFVTGDAPLDVGAILEAARAVARDPGAAREQPLSLPESLAQTSFTLEKVP